MLQSLIDWRLSGNLETHLSKEVWFLEVSQRMMELKLLGEIDNAEFEMRNVRK